MCWRAVKQKSNKQTNKFIKVQNTEEVWTASWQNQQWCGCAHPAKTQISLGICPVWSESSLCAQWVAKDPSFLRADSENSDQTGRMPRLIWVFAGHTATLLVLSWGGSYMLVYKFIDTPSYESDCWKCACCLVLCVKPITGGTIWRRPRPYSRGRWYRCEACTADWWGTEEVPGRGRQLAQGKKTWYFIRLLLLEEDPDLKTYVVRIH